MRTIGSAALGLTIAFGCLSARDASIANHEKENPSSDHCLSVVMECAAIQAPQRVTFTAYIMPSSPEAPIAPKPLVIKWKTSKGAIQTGQGTPVVVVDATGVENQCLTATVEVIDPNRSCSLFASCSTLVRPCCVDREKYDEYGSLSWQNEKVRLDKLAVQMKQLPNSEVSIFAYDGYKSPKGLARQRASRAKQYLTGRHGIEAARIRITADQDFVGIEPPRRIKLEFYIREHDLTSPCTNP